jgi:hypothetical protein
MGRRVVSHSFLAEDVYLGAALEGWPVRGDSGGKAAFPGLTERLPRLPPAASERGLVT